MLVAATASRRCSGAALALESTWGEQDIETSKLLHTNTGEHAGRLSRDIERPYVPTSDVGKEGGVESARPPPTRNKLQAFKIYFPGRCLQPNTSDVHIAIPCVTVRRPIDVHGKAERPLASCSTRRLLFHLSYRPNVRGPPYDMIRCEYC